MQDVALEREGRKVKGDKFLHTSQTLNRCHGTHTVVAAIDRIMSGVVLSLRRATVQLVLEWSSAVSHGDLQYIQAQIVRCRPDIPATVIQIFFSFDDSIF